MTMRTPALALAAFTALAAPAAAIAQPGPGLTDQFNEFDKPIPNALGEGPIKMQIMLAGDVRACVPPQANNDPAINPFYANQLYGGPKSNPVTASYAGGVTTVTMSGQGPLPVPPPVGYDTGGTFQNPTQGGTTYHIGLNLGFDTSPPCSGAAGNGGVRKVGKKWVYPDVETVPIPVLNFGWAGQLTPHNIRLARAAVLFLQNPVQAIGNTGTWYWATYVPGTGVPFSITNNGNTPITITLAGIVTGLAQPTDPLCMQTPTCKEERQILDQLNDTYYPAPGLPRSPFTPIPQLQGVQVSPGQMLSLPTP